LSLALFPATALCSLPTRTRRLMRSSILTYDGYRNDTVSRDPFIGPYTLTSPNSNLYYVAVVSGGRFGVRNLSSPYQSDTPFEVTGGTTGLSSYTLNISLSPAAAAPAARAWHDGADGSWHRRACRQSSPQKEQRRSFSGHRLSHYRPIRRKPKRVTQLPGRATLFAVCFI